MRRNFDLFVCSLFLLGSAFVSIMAYRSILNLSKAPQAWMNSIAEGEQRFTIYQADRCVGTFEYSAKKDTLFAVESSGELTASMSNQLIPMKLHGGAYFNPLGQLIKSKFTVEISLGNVSISTEDVNPIRLSLKLDASGQELRRNFNIPGPITVKRDRVNNSFAIDYLFLKQLQHSRANDVSEMLVKELQLSLKPVPAEAVTQQSKPICGQTALDLSSLGEKVERLQSLGTSLQDFLP